MANDATEVVVGASGRVLVGDPTLVTLPTNVATALAATWVEVGFVSEDGVTFTDSQDINDIPAWQSFYPIRKVVSSKASKLEFVMRQWNETTVPLAFGGGTISRVSGVTTYTPPAPGTIFYRAMVVEWTDGGNTFRLVVPRGLATGEVSSKIVRTDAADLPISFDVVPSGSPVAGQLSTQAWYLLTNDASFVIT